MSVPGTNRPGGSEQGRGPGAGACPDCGAAHFHQSGCPRRDLDPLGRVAAPLMLPARVDLERQLERALDAARADEADARDRLELLAELEPWGASDARDHETAEHQLEGARDRAALTRGLLEVLETGADLDGNDRAVLLELGIAWPQGQGA